TTGACGAAILFAREDGGHGRVFEGVVAYFKRSWGIVREEAEVRRFLIANAAWEGTFAAARSFVVLYVIEGLNETKAISGAMLGAPLAGVAIDLARPYLSATDGYQILWPVCAVPILSVIPLVYRMSRIEANGTSTPLGG